MDRPGFLADPRHGPLPALLLVLTVVTGVVDAVSILALGRVFVANMTGNVVFIGFALAGAPGFSLIASVVALFGFLLGALAGGFLVDRFGPRRGVLLRNTIAIEVVLLVICLVVLLVAPHHEGGPISIVVAGLAALAMGLQNAAARRIAVPDMTTSVLTMTLTGIAADHRHGGAGSVVRRVVVVVCMLVGALVGALLVLYVSVATALGLALLLLAGVGVTAAVAARAGGSWQG